MHSTNTTKVGASVPENFELTLVKNERRADTAYSPNTWATSTRTFSSW